MRRAAALLLVSLYLAGCAAPEPRVESEAPPRATPRPPPPPPSEGSVDVQVGDVWRYAGRDGSTTTVSVLAKDNGTIRVRSLTVKGENSTPVTSVFDERTFALHSLHDPRFALIIPFDPPIPIIVPAKDHEYHGNISIPTILGDFRQPVDARVVFYGAENVTVPAGNFTSYHYAIEISSQGKFRFKQTRHLWFAPEVHQAVLMFSDGRTDELVSYTPAPRVT